MLEVVNAGLLLFMLKWLRNIEKRLATLEGRLYIIQNHIGEVKKICQENGYIYQRKTYQD